MKCPTGYRRLIGTVVNVLYAKWRIIFDLKNKIASSDIQRIAIYWYTVIMLTEIFYRRQHSLHPLTAKNHHPNAALAVTFCVIFW